MYIWTRDFWWPVGAKKTFLNNKTKQGTKYAHVLGL